MPPYFLIAALCYVSVAWAISAWLKRADVIDPFWGPGFVVLSGLALVDAPVPDSAWLLFSMVAIWGTRLGIHLLVRWWNEPHEDRRYASMRDSGGHNWWLRSLITVFWLQGFIMWVVVQPVLHALDHNIVMSPILFGFGAVIWATGLYFESVGDWQLMQFRRDPKKSNEVLNSGLWRYTRHPNYFGDFMVWWGFFTMSYALEAPLWTVISPIVMSVLLMKFSGVGLLEKDISSRRPGYEEYIRNTSTFFPMPPRTSESS